MGVTPMKSLTIVSTQKCCVLSLIIHARHAVLAVFLLKIAPESRIRVKVVHLGINPREHC